MSINIGSLAPDFTLKDTDGNEVTLSSFIGKPVVVLFFPLAFTGVCTKELCSVRDNLEEYNSVNASVLAISVDSFFTLQQFKNQQNLNFPLLSDFNKETAKAYDAIYDEFFGMYGVAKRSAFVVDTEGKIAYAEVLEKASDLPNFDEIKQVLSNM
jgi:glutaredoxin-dependent peroxiredoxin